VLGTRPGRSTAEQLTLYKPVGLALQDATATALVLAGARERGIGAQITI
jgi:ornithine cyclodeaminase/alanine dehydrogenase-like protein (mu-crystallin family)